MKKLALVFMICILASASVFAQKKEKKSPEERAENQITRMTEELSLTDEQVQKLKPALLTKVTAVQEAKKSEDKEGVKTANKTYREVLKATLTEEQMLKHKELQKDRRTDKKGKKGPRPEDKE